MISLLQPNLWSGLIIVSVLKIFCMLVVSTDLMKISCDDYRGSADSQVECRPLGHPGTGSHKELGRLRSGSDAVYLCDHQHESAALKCPVYAPYKSYTCICIRESVDSVIAIHQHRQSKEVHKNPNYNHTCNQPMHALAKILLEYWW